MSTVPAALQAPLSDFDRSDEFVRSAIRRVDSARLNLQPAPERWTVLQCFAHLTAVNVAIADAMEKALDSLPRDAAAVDRLRPGLIWSLFFKILEPPVRFRARAPAAIQPSPMLDADETAAAFTAVHDRLRSLASRCEGVDLNRSAFRHPFIPLRISIGGAFLLIAAHDRRHLWQAEQTGHLQ
ncbi:MAG: DinB family protein [Acidobacteria bacterium]|nr:DinB family protein [Acidobacteriota bacterium]MDA1237282.1 DinB family protein [Acidobacteriota bacterium]